MNITRISRFLKRLYNRVKIAKDRPFSNLIKIARVEELVSCRESNMDIKSLGAFKIQDFNKKFYKLRIYDSDNRVKLIENKIRLFSQFLPKLYGVDRNYLLLDFLQGRTLTKNESLDIFFKIGRMCGEVNKIKFNGEKKAGLRAYNKQLNFLLKKKIISSEDYSRILRTFERLMKKIEYDVVLELSDICPGNFMIDFQNKLYFIDEDAIKYLVKGFSFASPLLRWFNKEQRRIFFEGYDSVNSTAFFHSDYEKFVTFLYYVVNIHDRFKTGQNYLNRLKNFLEFVYSEKIK